MEPTITAPVFENNPAIQPKKKIQILLLEDNPGDVELVEIYLKEAFPRNYELMTADRLSKGLELLSTCTFDVVLCDLSLPDSYGMDTFTKISAPCPEIPVIVLTGYGDESFGVHAVSLGAADFLHKSHIDSALLKRSITYCIERNNLHKQLLVYTKNLSESEKKYRLIFEDSKDPIYVSVPGGQLLDFNNAAVNLFGYSSQELKLANVNDFFDDEKEREELKRVLKEDGSINDFPATLLTKDGTKLRCLITAAVRTDEEGKDIYHGILRDVTQMLEIEKLKADKEVAERTAKARQEFLSVMSHEIRTPLNAVVGITELLVNESPKKSQLKNLNTLKFSARNLLNLINNVLDFSKIEAGKIQFEAINFNIRNLVDNIVESHSPQADQKILRLKIVFDRDIPETVCGDPVRLTQILDNLFANAIKFTDQGEVSIVVKTILAGDEVLKLSFGIHDSGIGIEKSKHEEIFESFNQAHPHTTRLYGGTGLGLAISKRLVELMGGKISVASEPGKGSVFQFELVFLRASVRSNTINETKSDLNKTDELSGKRILLVEDNPTNSELIRRFIVKWGAATDTADNGKSAIEKIKKNKYDLVLMDLQMPVMNGLEASDAIRAMGISDEELPIIAVTAFSTEEDKAQAMFRGMNDYISKPIDTNELYQKILKNIRNGRPDIVVDSAEEILSLKELIESFKEDKNFVSNYLDIFEKEFEQIPVHLERILNQNDRKALSELIHKVNPSVQRLGDTSLVDQMRQVRELITLNENPGDELEIMVSRVSDSCAKITAFIQSIKKEYL